MPTVPPPEILRLMDNARINLPGVLDAALKLALFTVLDEFLQDTNFWQEEIDYTTRVDRTSYTIAGTEDGAISGLISNVNSLGFSVSASMPTLGTLELVAAPSTAEVLTATVAYTVVDPVDSASYPIIPDGLVIKYGRGILSGLVGHMMLQPAKPYTNERMAIVNSRKFEATKAQARADVRNQNLYDGQRWRFPTTFQSSRRK